MSPGWWEGQGSSRLERDKAIVAVLQPGLRHELQGSAQLALVGYVVVKTASGVPHTIPTLIAFPPDYPRGEPVAFEIDGRFKHTPARHFYDQPDGRCCLWLDVASDWRPKDPDALRHFLVQLALFYHRQLILDIDPSAGWPGHEHVHGGEAYVQYLLERWSMTPDALRRMAPALTSNVHRNASCPCASGQRYRKCHQADVVDFLRRANNHSVDQLLEVLARDQASTR